MKTLPEGRSKVRETWRKKRSAVLYKTRRSSHITMAMFQSLVHCRPSSHWSFIAIPVQVACLVPDWSGSWPTVNVRVGIPHAVKLLSRVYGLVKLVLPRARDYYYNRHVHNKNNDFVERNNTTFCSQKKPTNILLIQLKVIRIRIFLN